MDALTSGEARSTDELDDREAEMYRLHAVNRWTLTKIGEQFGVSNQRVSQILQRFKAKLPPIDLDAIRRESIARHHDTIRRAFEVIEREGAPVTAGRDGAIVTDPETDAVVRDYSGRLAALETARKADVELRKLLGLDAAFKIEQSGSVRYELVAVDPAVLT